jgi:hypothetical protein
VWRQNGPPERWHPTTTGHGVTILKYLPFGMWVTMNYGVQNFPVPVLLWYTFAIGLRNAEVLAQSPY